MKLKRRNFILELVIGILGIYVLVLLLLFIFQRNLMYHPDENNYFGDKLEVDIEKVKITTSDNINLLGWFHKKDLKKFKTIVYFHGNAGKLENRTHKLNHFKDMNVNFLIISWRGFSGNDGKPFEEGLYDDGNSAIEWLKNIGLVEENIIDGFINNVLGTLNVIDTAMKIDSVNNFVLISTDKAVRPTNIMGKTKRVAEIFLQLCASENTKVKFSIVRFGNVFNSSGSVIPIFKKQISRGGPVTVTDKNATRYFMSIPEATELILEANDKAQGGEIFVLDMGNPVKIIDIAKKMISLSGLKVKFNNLEEGDILIKIIGLKSGEKLHEELFIGENIKKTDNKKILIASEPFLERKKFEHLMKLSKLAIKDNSEEKLIDLLNEYV